MSLKSEHDEYLSSKDFEEMYCDLFPSMYKLPITFFYGFRANNTFKEINKDQLDELNALTDQLRDLVMDSHPTRQQRMHNSVKVAKQILSSNVKLDPATKDYLKWIVANYDIPDTKVASNPTFDERTTDDVNKTLEDMINNNDIALTEMYHSI
jgi:2-hydroxy-3-keto-5-methylthiopentenyl-1-phosphate phosphatase